MTADAAAPLPATLSLVDDDADYSEFLAQHLETLGIQVSRYADGNQLLACATAFDSGFYIVDLMLPGLGGVELIEQLRRRTRCGLLVVSGQAAPDVYARVIDAGADMFLAKPVTFDQIVLAVRGIHRRIAATPGLAWRLDGHASCLHAPDGATITLSAAELALLACFVDARGEVVGRAALCRCLGRDADVEGENLLSATIHRLRRRIEQATPLPVPLQTQARAGYRFRGEIGGYQA